MTTTKTQKANPALAATEKARKAAVAEIDARLAGNGPIHEGTVLRGDGKRIRVTVPRDEPRDHEEPSPKERANNAANLAAARATKGPKAAKPATKAKASAKRAHGPTSRPTAGAKKPAFKRPKRLSALDAAAQVLAGASKPMNSADLITAMASRGLWSSPGGKTPEATLYAAMTREIAKKGTAARFKKHSRGLFVARKGA